MLDTFRNKRFMQHDAQGSEQSVMRAYDAEEATFCKQVRRISIDDVPLASNIILGYKIYNLKYNDDPTLMLWGLDHALY